MHPTGPGQDGGSRSGESGAGAARPPRGRGGGSHPHTSPDGRGRPVSGRRERGAESLVPGCVARCRRHAAGAAHRGAEPACRHGSAAVHLDLPAERSGAGRPPAALIIRELPTDCCTLSLSPPLFIY